MAAGTADRGSPSLHSSPSGGGPRGSHTAPGPAFDVWRGLPRGRDSGVGPVMESWSQGAGAGAGAVGQDRRKMQDASKTPEHPIGPTPCLLHSADLLQAAPAPLADLLGPCGGARMGAPTSAPGGPRGAHQLAASSQLACRLSLVRGTDRQTTTQLWPPRVRQTKHRLGFLYFGRVAVRASGAVGPGHGSLWLG